MFGIDDVLFGGLSSMGQFFGRQQQNEFSEDQAQKMMDFQERMSSTAYQRQMKDMAAAGLNPILAAGHASGASTPSGAMASSQMTDMVTPALTTAMAKNRLDNEMSLMDIDKRKREGEVTNVGKEGGRIDADAEAARAAADRSSAEAELTRQVTAKKLPVELKKLGGEADVSSAEGARRKGDAPFWETTFGKALRGAGVTLNEVGSALFGRK